MRLEPTPELATQELRIAASFSGGVSLAIWMGGLTFELDRLLRSSDAVRSEWVGQAAIDAPDPRYAALLRLLRVDVDVDVLTGTSAGGINGAALAMARAYGSTLEPLREVWLEQGSFTTLLRGLDEAAPPSLLQGDGVLLAGLGKGLEGIRRSAAATPGLGRRTAVGTGEPFPSRENRMRLLVTATMTAPDVTTVRDSLGTAVFMEDNQALFTFEQPAYDPDDPQPSTGDLEVATLARAARSSASYPAAFEPSFVRVGAGPGSAPDLSAHLGVHSSRWMIDGGLRNNQPVGTALRAVWEQPAGERVRRVLLHVVPDPGQLSATAASPDEQPGLLTALGLTVAAPFVQSWRADLDAIRRQSAGASRRTQGLAPLHQLVSRDPTAWPVLAAALHTTRATWVADDFVTGLDAQLSRFATAGTGPAAGWTDYSSGLFDRIRTACRADATAHWQRAADPLAAPADATADEAAADALAHEGADLFNAALGVLLRALRAREAAGESPPPGLTWAEGAQGLHACRVAGGASVRFERDLLVAFLREQLSSCGAVSEDEAVAWARALQGAWLDAAFPRPDASAPRPAAAPETGTPVARDASARLRDSWLALLAWVRSTGLPMRLLGGDVGDEPVFRRVLLSRAAVEVLTLGDGRLSDQGIDLVQLSGYTRTALAPQRDRPADKLMGVGLAHFGAFVRRSWRANDWMWGRLDGAGWLVHLLLQPERLRAVAATLAPQGSRREQVDALVSRLRHLAATGAGGVEDPQLLAWWDEHASELEPDLRALAADELTVAAVPRLALAVAYGLQRDVAAEELPVVATAMQQAEDGREVAPRRADAEFVRLVQANLTLDGGRLQPQAVRPALDVYRVREQTGPADLLGDSGLRSTVLDALAVGSAALDSSTPDSVPLLPQVSRTARRASAGLARSAHRNSLAGWAAVGLGLVGVLLLVIGGPLLTALGVPLVVGALLALVLLGLDAPDWLARVRRAVLPVGVVLTVLAAWWASSRLSDETLVGYGRSYGPAAVALLVAAAGLSATALLWLLLRGLGRLTRGTHRTP